MSDEVLEKVKESLEMLLGVELKVVLEGNISSLYKDYIILESDSYIDIDESIDVIESLEDLDIKLIYEEIEIRIVRVRSLRDPYTDDIIDREVVEYEDYIDSDGLDVYVLIPKKVIKDKTYREKLLKKLNKLLVEKM